ncbi:MAG: TlpA disulfide reductase family protein [Candidatus Devosia phytovorans]|uniref:TlpA disulfide reductase family protein n=1 Tax=Candidatus Devosia phytovorans TaxID=3121372 RepID=A0AAJ5VTD8_9HYPH|nr:TlpA disulfide reductase family protein [Devosia sp.]WEK04483.1 MAG: TlpA disulfide reductase family protein [Devosia sp.]
MTDMQAPRPGATSRVRLWIILGLVGLAVAIAAWVYVGNGAQAKECPVQADDAAAIDAAAVGELAALNGTGEGRGYATMAFKDASGTEMTIGDFKGKALLVNFWASWCVPCREEMPALDALATKYNSDAFMVLPINLDIGANGLEKAEGFLEENQFANLPLYADNTFSAFERLKQEAVAIGLPATLVLDENGCELGVLQGPAEWNTPDGEKVIETLIGLGA